MNEIVQTETDFCKLSVDSGFNKALIAYADSNVVKPTNGEYPVEGLEELTEKLSKEKNDSSIVTWKPRKVEVANSCDLGYTFGNWEYKTETENGDTTYYGNFVTIWKKQKDGKWKFVYDGGNNTPDPKFEKH